MSKKKKKFKKLIKARINQELQTAYQEKPVNNLPSQQPAPEIKQKEPVESLQPSSSSSPMITNEYVYVAKDIKKVGIIFSVILLMLISIYFINIKTDWVANISDWLAKYLHIL